MMRKGTETKVLLLSHSAGIGGASFSLVTVTRELCQAGCSVHVLSPDGPICRDLERLGATVTRWEPPACYWLGASVYSSGVLKLSPGYLIALLLLPFRLLVAVRLIQKLIQQFGITIIHVNSLVMFPLALPVRFICRKRQIKVVWHIRELVGDQLVAPVRTLIIKGIIAASDIIIAITSNEAAPFLFSEKVRVIHNAVDEAWFVETVETQRVPDRHPIVCMATGFLAGKGIPNFLKMAHLVAQQYPDAQFELYTTQPRLTGRLDRLAWKIFLRLSPTARWASSGLWNVTECLLDRRIKLIFGQKITPSSYSRCSIFVNPSEVGAPWGRVIIEAMCAGLPVVATGSSQEFVIDGETGFLVSPGRPDLLARRVGQLLQDPELRASMGDAGRKRAKQLFSPEIYRSKILGAFGLLKASECNTEDGTEGMSAT